MKQIAIYGAFDRFNYGDLLFPLILERVFNSYSSEFKFDYYGTINSDLSIFGAKPTKSVENLFRRGNLEDDSIVIIAGGEILTPGWFDIYGCLIPENLQNFTNSLKRNIPKETLRKVRPSLESTDLEQPFVVAPEDFFAQVRVVYNAVGGIDLSDSKFPKKLRKVIEKKIEKATFCSVRDQLTFNSLAFNNKPFSPILAPDSATLISTFFPIDFLLTMIKPDIRNTINTYKNGYITLQISRLYASNQTTIDLLVHEIEEIYQKYHLPTILCPIGTATYHEDHVPLQAIQRQIKTPAYLVSEPSIFDIMAVIAKSCFFVGTSLHGAITAMSFAKPNLALTLKVHKLESYQKTWGLPQLQNMIPINQISTALARAISVPQSQLDQKRQELIDRSLESFDLMHNALAQNGNQQKSIQRKNIFETIKKSWK